MPRFRLTCSPELNPENSGDTHFIFGGVVQVSGLVIAHDGDDIFYAVVFNSTFGLKLFQVVDGS